MNTLAAVLTELNAPLQVIKLEVPALDIGQVLVDVKSASICGAQLGEVSGAKGADPYLPHLLGHEGAGVVLEVGPGVVTVKPGDHVVLHWRKGAGIEATPPQYLTATGQKIGAGPVATFTQKAVVSENRCTAIDKDVPFPIGSLLGCGVTTALGLLQHEARLRIGESVLVVGAGGVGMAAAHGAKLMGGYPVVAVEPSETRRALASVLGAVTYEWLDQIDWPEGFDVVVECTGIPHVVEAAFERVRAGGRMVLVGQPKAGEAFMFRNARFHYKGKTIMDSQGGLTNPTVDIPRYVRLYQAGHLRLRRLLGKEFPLTDINAAMSDAVSAVSGRTMLVME